MLPLLGIIFFIIAARPVIACYVEVNNIETACPYNSLTINNWGGDFVNGTNCGLKVNKKYWAIAPLVIYLEADRSATYTLMMQDLDVPLPLVGPVYVNWLVANIPGPDLALGNISRGNTLYGYMPPLPPPGSGNHRYTFVLYKETQLAQKVKKPVTRLNFKQPLWMIRQKVPLCGPVAGTMFLA